MSFMIDEKLLEDSMVVCDLDLSRLLVRNDKETPWFILVPRKRNVVEIIDLNSEEQMLLMEEIVLVSEFLKEYYRPFKINIAGLGNITRQLHIHIIARYENDRAFPNPIFQSPKTMTFEDAEMENIVSNFLDFVH